jgi:hypothetical protein
LETTSKTLKSRGEKNALPATAICGTLAEDRSLLEGPSVARCPPPRFRENQEEVLYPIETDGHLMVCNVEEATEVMTNLG